MWCDDKALRVKLVKFAKDTSGVRDMGQSTEARKGNGRGEQVGKSHLVKAASSFRGRKTSAEVG